jgi:copper chaperone NosL
MLIRKTVLEFVVVAAVVISLLLAPSIWGSEKGQVKPTSKDKCPVCGMFVAKYPDFIAYIVFKDSSVAFFDGTKDMLKYYLNMSKYNSNLRESDIDFIHVTDYYSLALFDGRKAYYVHGSNVYGPMGAELIPFNKSDEAKEFMKDHKGKGILRFQDINISIIKGLD